MRLPQLVVHANPEALCEVVASELAALVKSAVGQRGKCSLVLAGGRTPKAIYARLGTTATLGPEVWGKVVLLFGDERAVPADDPQSNHRMVHEALIEPLAARGAHPVVLRIEGERKAADAAARYAHELRELVAEAGLFDVVLLGMGDDGHVASIFPGDAESEALGESDALVIATTSPLPPASRVSLTLPLLARTMNLVMLVTGASKALRLAEAYGEIEAGDTHFAVSPSAAVADLPAARIASHLTESTAFRWHIDDAANGSLSS